MRRFAPSAVLVLAMSLLALPAHAEAPRFFFEKGYDGIAVWQIETTTELTTNAIAFFTADRGSTPGERTTTFLSYSSETLTWDGTQWQPSSSFFALAHSDNGDPISYQIGPAGRTISASATAPARLCVPAFPDCVPAGSAEIEATFTAVGPILGSPGHHITDWNGSGCKIDFRSGKTIARTASATATVDGVAVAGDFLRSEIEAFQGTEVQLC